MSNAIYPSCTDSKMLPFYLVVSESRSDFIIYGTRSSTDSIVREYSIGTEVIIKDDKDLLKERLRRKWPDILREAMEASFTYPDPVQSMIRLLNSISSGNDDLWDEIVDEPYG